MSLARVLSLVLSALDVSRLSLAVSLAQSGTVDCHQVKRDRASGGFFYGGCRLDLERLVLAVAGAVTR